MLKQPNNTEPSYDHIRQAIQLLRIANDYVHQEDLDNVLSPLIVEFFREKFLYEPINEVTSIKLFEEFKNLEELLREQFKCSFSIFSSADPTIKFAMKLSKVQLYDKLKYKFHYNSNFELTHDGIASVLYSGETFFFVGKKMMRSHSENLEPIWYIISLTFSR